MPTGWSTDERVHRREKRRELGRVEHVVRADAAAEVEAVGADLGVGGGEVVRAQAAGEEDGVAHKL